jgi:hypothetical protein
MPEGNWKIHVKYGTTEIEVVGNIKEETMSLFEQVAERVRDADSPGGAKLFPWKPKGVVSGHSSSKP